MTSPEQPLLAELKAQLAALAGDVRRMAALRAELARRELAADARTLRRLAIGLAVAAVLATSVLPLLATAAAELLDGRLGFARTGWLVVCALVLLAGAIAVGLVAWRRFRRRFIGLAETREELREDLVWLKEVYSSRSA